MIRIQSYDKIDLTLIGGPPGAGKTTISNILVEKTAACVFDKDESSPLTEAGLQTMRKPKGDRSSPEYVSIFRPREYETMMNYVFSNLRVGNSCVANAPFGPEFLDPEWRFMLDERCKAISGRVISINYVWLEIDGEILLKSLINRDYERDYDKIKNWDKWWSEQQSKPKPSAGCFVLDVSERLHAAEYADKIINQFDLSVVGHFPQGKPRPAIPPIENVA